MQPLCLHTQHASSLQGAATHCGTPAMPSPPEGTILFSRIAKISHQL